jgi:hypothetical protein
VHADGDGKDEGGQQRPEIGPQPEDEERPAGDGH